MHLLFASAAVSSAFNLVCSGTITSDSIYQRGKTEPYSYTYRIDLDKKKWCEADCGAIHDIYDVQPAFLVLNPPKDIDTSDGKDYANSNIDRQTGHQQILMESGREASILIMKWDGQCDKRPFTGFTPIQTKF